MCGDLVHHPSWLWGGSGCCTSTLQVAHQSIYPIISIYIYISHYIPSTIHHHFHHCSEKNPTKTFILETSDLIWSYNPTQLLHIVAESHSHSVNWSCCSDRFPTFGAWKFTKGSPDDLLGPRLCRSFQWGCLKMGYPQNHGVSIVKWYNLGWFRATIGLRSCFFPKKITLCWRNRQLSLVIGHLGHTEYLSCATCRSPSPQLAFP